jgi:hypothetical protein
LLVNALQHNPPQNQAFPRIITAFQQLSKPFRRLHVETATVHIRSSSEIGVKLGKQKAKNIHAHFPFTPVFPKVSRDGMEIGGIIPGMHKQKVVGNHSITPVVIRTIQVQVSQKKTRSLYGEEKTISYPGI